MDDFKKTVPQLVQDTSVAADAAAVKDGAGSPKVFSKPPYSPWRRHRTYVSFGLGIGAASMLFFAPFPHTIVMGWFALGMGIPAVLVGKKEVSEFPQAANVPFIKWGIRTGMLGIIIGPASAIIYGVLIAAFSLRF